MTPNKLLKGHIHECLESKQNLIVSWTIPTTLSAASIPIKGLGEKNIDTM